MYVSCSQHCGACYSNDTSPHSYRNLATEHESLMQKYLHLLQIVETEKTVAKQLRQQIEDGEIEVERLKAEVTFVYLFVCNLNYANLTIPIANVRYGDKVSLSCHILYIA